MNNKPLISICIITCNQPEAVKNVIYDISLQESEDIEILVRDDSSDSKTEKIVEKAIKEINIPIQYFHSKKESFGGYDKALLDVTEKANGKYVWWFGDDRLSKKAIDKVVSIARSKDDFSFIWLNARNINDSSDIGFDLGGDMTFSNASDIFEKNVGLLGFPTITILNREDAVRGIKDAKKFIGTTLTGFFLLLYVITQKNKKAIFIQEPIILSEPKPHGENRWYDSFQVHGVNYFLVAKNFKNSILPKSFRKGMSDQYGRIWRAVIYERIMGLSTRFASSSQKIWKMTKLYWLYPEFYIALPLMLLPRFVLRLVYKLYKH